MTNCNKPNQRCNKACDTIVKYEEAKFIMWKKIELKAALPSLGNLSAIQAPFLRAIREQIARRFPEPVTGGSLSDLQVSTIIRKFVFVDIS